MRNSRKLSFRDPAQIAVALRCYAKYWAGESIQFSAGSGAMQDLNDAADALDRLAALAQQAQPLTDDKAEIRE